MRIAEPVLASWFSWLWALEAPAQKKYISSGLQTFRASTEHWTLFRTCVQGHSTQLLVSGAMPAFL